jgi:RNase P subunit RPR2
MPTLTFDTTVEVEKDFKVFCGSCNAGLCLQSSFRKSYNRREDQLVVEPCKDCLEKAHEAGREEALEELENE